jgi:hypothetical protein
MIMELISEQMLNISFRAIACNLHRPARVPSFSHNPREPALKPSHLLIEAPLSFHRHRRYFIMIRRSTRRTQPKRPADIESPEALHISSAPGPKVQSPLAKRRKSSRLQTAAGGSIPLESNNPAMFPTVAGFQSFNIVRDTKDVDGLSVRTPKAPNSLWASKHSHWKGRKRFAADLEDLISATPFHIDALQLKGA